LSLKMVRAEGIEPPT